MMIVVTILQSFVIVIVDAICAIGALATISQAALTLKVSLGFGSNLPSANTSTMSTTQHSNDTFITPFPIPKKPQLPTYILAYHCDLETFVCDTCCGVAMQDKCHLYDFDGWPWTCNNWDWGESSPPTSPPTVPPIPDRSRQAKELDSTYMMILVEKFAVAGVLQLGLALSHPILFFFYPSSLIVWCCGAGIHITYLWLISSSTILIMLAGFRIPTKEFLKTPISMGLLFAFMTWLSLRRYKEVASAKKIP